MEMSCPAGVVTAGEAAYASLCPGTVTVLLHKKTPSSLFGRGMVTRPSLILHL